MARSRAKKLKRMRVLVIMHESCVPPETLEGLGENEIDLVKTEYDVCATLSNLGHEVRSLGLYNDLTLIENAIADFHPHVCFNLLEEFHGASFFDQHMVSYLELKQVRYTGCNPRGLTLARDKALCKKILAYHRIPVPQFTVFPMGRRIRLPKKLDFPVIVKSLTEEGSVGISQASVVWDHDKLIERVAFIHRTIQTPAIAEQFVDGRELYVPVMGNRRVETFPVWELMFDNLPEDAPRIATGKVKWDNAYRRRAGVHSQRAERLEPAVERRIHQLCRRIYKVLGMSGYARMDLRLSPDGQPYLLEANPNPQLSYGDDFAESIESTAMDYEQLIEKILRLALRYRPGLVV